MARLRAPGPLGRIGRRPRPGAAARYAGARRVDGKTPWRAAPFAVLDLETTGLDPRVDEVIQFGVVPIDAARIPVRGIVEGLVRPSRMPERRNVEIHGIRPSDLAAARLPPDALEPLLDALCGRVLVAHAAHVERAFLRPLLDAAGTALAGPVVDTVHVWRLVQLVERRPDPGLVGLGSLAQALGLPVHRPHHAVGDALTTAQCLLALGCRLAAAAGSEPTVRDLAGAGRRLEHRRRVGA